jgi:hypothetical protein
MMRTSPAADRREALRMLGALALVSTFGAHAANAKNDTKMLNGIWKIEATPPSKPGGTLGEEYLPTGTRLRLLVQGPTAVAMEENRTDELFVTVGVLPPWTPALCHTGIGASTTFGANLCGEDGSPLAPKGDASLDFEGSATFSRLTAKQLEDQDEIFFTELGAKVGARLMTINLKYKGVVWNLWMKSPDLMIGEAYVQGTKRNDVDSYPMYWRREK